MNIPVIAVNSIRALEDANYLIANNLVEFVAIGRAQLADHNFVKHIEENQPIVTCLGCKPCKWFYKWRQLSKTPVISMKGNYPHEIK